MIITSVSNEIVKETTKLLQKKYREETGLFLIEGEKGIKEAIDAGIELERIFINSEVQNPFNLPNIIETTEAVLEKISDTKTAPKFIGVAKQPKQNIEDLKTLKKVILLEGIKDAGNLGTIIRSATAFGIDGIVLFNDTVDVYNPKCVRSTVGNLWKTKIFKIKDYAVLSKYFDSFERIGTLPKGKNVIPLKEFKPADKVLLMFGSEADGLSKQLKDFATKNVTIEMSQNVESLNLSTSVSIIMYEIMNK